MKKEIEVISIINQKGGVGKTTVCLNLGAGLAKKGFKVLLIDIDPQANLTQSFRFKKSEGNIYKLLRKQFKIEDCINKVTDNIFIIPSIEELAYLQTELLQNKKNNLRLKEAVKDLRISKYFDYVLIDNGPTLNSFMYNSLAASDSAIICLDAESIYSVDGLNLVIKTINKTQNELNNKLKDFRLLLNFYDKRTVIGNGIEKTLRDSYQDKVFNTTIRRCLALKESQAKKQDIFDYAPKRNGAIDFLNLIEEMTGGIKNGE